MSMFTLAIISCLTSNLPWLMDLTFQVPMQYCSLQHQTLLLSPVTSTTGCCFCFGSISPFFLELFFHSSPVVYWAPTDLGAIFQWHIFLPFHTVHGILKARILKWSAIPTEYLNHKKEWNFAIYSNMDGLGRASKVAQSCLTLCDPMDYSPWNSSGQNTGVGSLSLLHGIFLTQGSNPGLPHCRHILYQLSYKGSPRTLESVAYPFPSRSSQPRNRTGSPA